MKVTQVLPQSERDLLAVLIGDELKGRVKSLHKGGWTLQAISQAFTPPKQRSTLHSWTKAKVKPMTTPPVPLLLTTPVTSLIPSLATPPLVSRSSSSSSSIHHLPTAENSDLAPRAKKDYRMFDDKAPKLTPAVRNRIIKIAPIARRYRSKANPNGSYRIANDELTEIVKNQYARGVSIRELSLAAGVTYRAMARRLGK